MTAMLTFIMNTINKEPASKSKVRPVQKDSYEISYENAGESE